MDGGPEDDAVQLKYTCKIYDMGVDFATYSPVGLFFFNDFQYWLPFISVGILFGELWVGPEPDKCVALRKEQDKAYEEKVAADAEAAVAAEKANPDSADGSSYL